MRLLIYADPAFASSAGIERLAQEFLNRCASEPDLEVTLLVGRDLRSIVEAEYASVENFTIKTSLFTRRQLFLIWGMLGLNTISKLEDTHDVLFIPAHIHIPVTKIRKVGEVCDLLDLHYPPRNLKERLFKPIVLRKFITTCDALISISEHTKSDVVESYSIDPDSIHTAYLGYNKTLFNSNPEQLKFDDLRKTPYLLYVGSLYSRRYANLIEAFSILVHKYGIEHNLVLVGGRESIDKGGLSISEKIKKNDVENRTVILQGLDDSAVANLMKNCDLFIYPSNFEGFGIPPLEAAACGKAVVVGNNTSLKELYSEIAEMINDVFDENEIASKVAAVLGDSERKSKMEADSLRFASKFSWDETFRKTMSVLRDKVSNKKEFTTLLR